MEHYQNICGIVKGGEVKEKTQGMTDTQFMEIIKERAQRVSKYFLRMAVEQDGGVFSERTIVPAGFYEAGKDLSPDKFWKELTNRK